MPSLFRSLSARLRPRGQSHKQSSASESSRQPRVNPRKQVHCKVLLLDGTDLNIVVPKRALAEELYEQVYYSLDLEERDYFALQFTDHYHVQHWLDPCKQVRKQVPIGPPYTLRFRAKFYASEPSNLREELTRYQFFLQLKQDIVTGRLPCQREVAVELAAYSLQSELGDFNPVEHTALFISEFRFHPEQDEAMELAIVERYKLCRGQTPAQAELNFLARCKWLELYGVDMHVVEGKDGNQYSLGLTPQGMLVFDGPQKIGLFFWEKIQKLDFKNKKLTLVVEEDADQSNNGQIQLHTFVFNLSSHKACKHLWKCAIEHHSFFRLRFRGGGASRTKTGQLFRLGSTFKYRGRTEYETVHKEAARLSRRQSSTFERRPSQRFGPRQSHAARREATREQKRQEIREQIASQPPIDRSEVTVGTIARPTTLIDDKAASSAQAPPLLTTPTRLPAMVSRNSSAQSHSSERMSTDSSRSESTSSQHITSIPIGKDIQQQQRNSPQEKTDAAATSRIPVYVVANSPLHSQPQPLAHSTPLGSAPFGSAPSASRIPKLSHHQGRTCASAVTGNAYRDFGASHIPRPHGTQSRVITDL